MIIFQINRSYSLYSKTFRGCSIYGQRCLTCFVSESFLNTRITEHRIPFGPQTVTSQRKSTFCDVRILSNIFGKGGVKFWCCVKVNVWSVRNNVFGAAHLCFPRLCNGVRRYEYGPQYELVIKSLPG